MSRIPATLRALRENGRTALIPFVTAGDPSAEVTSRLLHALVGAGANVLEIGVPFSDPMADGPVIQRGSERALANGMSLRGTLGLVEDFRADDDQTPIVLMGYLNPVESFGYARFAERAAAAGVDGVLLVDLPPEEAAALNAELAPRGIDMVYLLAPTTSDARIRRVCAVARGYVYYVALKGVTGAANLDVDAVAEQVVRIRALTELPIGVGFGISDAAAARAVGALADAVIVGSALVRRIEERVDEPAQLCAHVAGLIGEMRAALDADPATS